MGEMSELTFTSATHLIPLLIETKINLICDYHKGLSDTRNSLKSAFLYDTQKVGGGVHFNAVLLQPVTRSVRLENVYGQIF
jgi:hypothetical protein